MPRRRFRYDPATDRMVEVPLNDEPDAQHLIRGDLPPFVSPLDGTIVEGARAYREHMQKHNVVPFEQGSEKTTVARTDRTALREYLWEKVDRVNRGHKAQD